MKLNKAAKKANSTMFIVTFVALLLSLASFAWINANKDISSDSLKLNILFDNLNVVEYNNAEFVLVDKDGVNMTGNNVKPLTIPGKKAIYRVVITNNSPVSINLSEIGLKAPLVYTGDTVPSDAGNYDEIPRIVTGTGTEKYYFGTQLRVTLVGLYVADGSEAFNGSIGSGATVKYCATGFNGNTSGAVNNCSLSIPALADRKLLEDDLVSRNTVLATFGGDTGFELEASKYLAIYIEVEFVNLTDTVQDEYWDFGDNAETKEMCKRNIYVLLSDDEQGGT